MITATFEGMTIELHEDMRWLDRYSHESVKQTTTWTTTGAVYIQSKKKLSGIPITLASGEVDGWLKKSVLDVLNTWRGVAGAVLSVNIYGDIFNVMFDHAAGAIQEELVEYVSDPTQDDLYRVTIRWITV